MTPTPSAPTAEMLAQEAKRLLHKALRDAEGGRDEWIRQHDAAIDRLAALARSEPPPVDVAGKAGDPAEALYDDWWRLQTMKGDPSRRAWLARDAYVSGHAQGRLDEHHARSEPPTPGAVPEGWVLMPRTLTEGQALYAQGAFMDVSWDAVECFAARYAALISVTEAARRALPPAIETQAGEPKPL